VHLAMDPEASQTGSTVNFQELGSLAAAVQIFLEAAQVWSYAQPANSGPARYAEVAQLDEREP